MARIVIVGEIYNADLHVGGGPAPGGPGWGGPVDPGYFPPGVGIPGGPVDPGYFPPGVVVPIPPAEGEPQKAVIVAYTRDPDTGAVQRVAFQVDYPPALKPPGVAVPK